MEECLQIRLVLLNGVLWKPFKDKGLRGQGEWEKVVFQFSLHPHSSPAPLPPWRTAFSCMNYVFALQGNIRSAKGFSRLRLKTHWRRPSLGLLLPLIFCFCFFMRWHESTLCWTHGGKKAQREVNWKNGCVEGTRALAEGTPRACLGGGRGRVCVSLEGVVLPYPPHSGLSQMQN